MFSFIIFILLITGMFYALWILFFIGIEGFGDGESSVEYMNDRYYTPKPEKEASKFNTFHRSIYLIFFRLGVRHAISKVRKSKTIRTEIVKTKMDKILEEEKNRHAK